MLRKLGTVLIKKLPLLASIFRIVDLSIIPDQLPQDGVLLLIMLVSVFLCFGSDLIDESKAQPTDFHEAYLDFILLMIDVGPLSSHVEYIYMLMDDRDVDFREYFQVSLASLFTEEGKYG